MAARPYHLANGCTDAALIRPCGRFRRHRCTAWPTAARSRTGSEAANGDEAGSLAAFDGGDWHGGNGCGLEADGLPDRSRHTVASRTSCGRFRLPMMQGTAARTAEALPMIRRHRWRRLPANWQTVAASIARRQLPANWQTVAGSLAAFDGGNAAHGMRVESRGRSRTGKTARRRRNALRVPFPAFPRLFPARTGNAANGGGFRLPMIRRHRWHGMANGCDWQTVAASGFR